jgi:hypothetical protein
MGKHNRERRKHRRTIDEQCLDVTDADTLAKVKEILKRHDVIEDDGLDGYHILPPYQETGRIEIDRLTNGPDT